MTLRIRSGKLRLFFWVPTALLKTRLAYKIVRAAVNGAQKDDGEQKPDDSSALIEINFGGDADSFDGNGAVAEVASDTANAEEKDTTEKLTDNSTEKPTEAGAPDKTIEKRAEKPTEKLFEEPTETPTEAVATETPTETNKPEIEIPRRLLKDLYKALRKTIKANGHFTLVDVISEEDKTRIKVRL